MSATIEDIVEFLDDNNVLEYQASPWDLPDEDDEKREFQNKMVGIAQMGKSCGIHLIVSTQRPARETIIPDVRDNFGAQIALRVRDSNASNLIITQGGVEKPGGMGEAILRTTKGSTRIQCALV